MRDLISVAYNNGVNSTWAICFSSSLDLITKKMFVAMGEIFNILWIDDGDYLKIY